MKRKVTVTAFVRSFADYINRIAYRRERFLLTRGSRVVAEIRPVPEVRRLSELAELLSGLPRLGPEEAEAFRRDWERAREELGRPEERDRWPS